MTTWTDAEMTIVIKGYNQGLSASLISKDLPGRTRNAVLGIIHRNPDLFTRVETGQSTQQRNAGIITRNRQADRRRSRSRTVAVLRPSSVRRKGPIRKRQQADAINNLAVLAGTIRPLADLKPHACKWVISGEGALAQMCGRPADHKHDSITRRSYCREHGDIATLTSKRRKAS